jgi:hypothetical protein
VGPDLPGEADVPPDGHADRQDDQAGASRAARPSPAEPETRDRQEYHADLCVAVSTEKSVTTQRIATAEQAAAEQWDKSAEQSRWMWTEYQRKWPAEDRAPVDSSDDPPGSWRGDRNRFLDTAKNSQVEVECDRIVEREKEEISPAMRTIESQDPDRHLIGFEHRLKGRDRIKEKVYDTMEEDIDSSALDALSIVPDTIRYTFEYREAQYTQGVWADVGRLKDQGFELHRLRNAWSDEQYKGVNSQWIEPDTGQRFEVQFHTRISFEAKQLTHASYERLRTHKADKFEQMVLEAFQKKVAGEVPVPPGAADIPDYP